MVLICRFCFKTSVATAAKYDCRSHRKTLEKSKVSPETVLNVRLKFATYALKGQQNLAQGNALGLCVVARMRPVRAKVLLHVGNLILLPFQGA